MPKLARLDDRALIAVRGDDARPFLHNLLTQDVEGLAPGELRYAALLTPQGRLLHDLFLWRREGEVVVETAAGGAEDLMRRLTMYRLRAKVALARLDEPIWALWDVAGSPPQGGAWIADPRHPGLGWRALGAQPAIEAEPAAPAAYDRHRLALGVPDALADGLSDKAYPIEVNLDRLNAIDFHKGCFVGQETTSRMHRRGTLKSRAAGFRYQGADPARGDELLAGTLRAGEVLAARDGVGLALVRLDRIGGEVTLAGRPVAITPPEPG